MSRNILKKMIEEVTDELHELISYYDYNLQISTVIECSEKLDRLITAYIKTKS